MGFKLLSEDAKFTWSQVVAALTVGLASMVTGYTGGYTSPALPSLNSTENAIMSHQGYITDDQETWIGFFLPLGALVGSTAIGGVLIEVLGRRGLLMAIAPVYALAWVLIGMALRVEMIYAGRFVCGLCVGLLTVCMPVYLGETLHESVRGMLGLMPTLLGNGGVVLAFIVGYGLDWRILAFVGAMLPALYFGLLFIVPETPRWLISKSKPEDARKAMQWLRGDKEDTAQEFGEVEKFFADQKANSLSKKLDFGEFKLRVKRAFVWRYVKPVSILVMLMFFQQLSGINAVVFYMQKIFTEAGLKDPSLGAILVGLANVAATLASSFCVDRLGRKLLLYVSGAATTGSLVVIGFYFFFRDRDVANVAGYEWIILVFLVVYIMAFSFGFGPIPWMMMGEILPANIRGPGASIVTASNWGFACIVTKGYSFVRETIGNSFTFWCFGVICALCVVFTFFFVPETRGRSLEEIERRMTGGKPGAASGEAAAAGAAATATA